MTGRLQGSHVIQELLQNSTNGRRYLEPITPLAESLEWQLSCAFFAAKGSRAFRDSHGYVPYQITNDGVLARNAAELAYEHAMQLGFTKDSPDPYVIAEIGAGSGLFAKLFLDLNAVNADFGKSGTYDADVNGNGIVNDTDRSIVKKQTGKSLSAALPLDD